MSTIKSSAENLTLNADGANNDVIIQSNGSTKVTVDGQNSRVGIGTASPASVLEISDASSPVLRVTDSDNSNTAFIQADGTNAAYFGTLTNHDVRIAPNNSTKVIIKTDGKVGLSTTSPAALLSLGQDSGSGDSAASSGVAFETSNNADMFQLSTVGGANNDARGLKFSADGTERMRMSASGHLLLGTTAIDSINAGGMSINAGSYGQYALKVNHSTSNGDGYGIMVNIPGYTGTGGQYMMRFYTNGGSPGSIKSTQNATQFNTSSDYRLKENVDYTWDATTRLKQLKPARFNFINDDTNTLVDGFMAHEVSSVVPEAISGIKDGMTAEVLYVEDDELPEGKVVGDVKEASVPDMQGIDQSKLVPLLVKTIQELEARITALEA